MIRTQKYALAIGLLILAASFIYVPFESTARKDGEYSKAYEGYSLIWAPPSPVNICIYTFGLRVNSWESPKQIAQKAKRTCHASPIFSRVAASALAITALTLAAYLLIGALGQKPAPLPARRPFAPAPPEAEPSTQSLAELLINDFGTQFPVSSGNGKKDDPLVITAKSDYVAIEHAIVKHVLGKVREQYELDSQKLINADGRQIDELIFSVKSIGEENWTGHRRFYFDITKGFSNLG